MANAVGVSGVTMKCLRILGFALTAVICAGHADAEELSGTLRKIKETGAINIGYRNSSIPFSYLDDNQKPIGFAIDICLKIVDAVKKELKLDKLTVEFNPVTSSTRIPLLANGTIDLECGSTTNNPDRLNQVAFTNTHFLTATRFISKKPSKLNSIEDLKGKTVASTSGTTNIKQLTEANAARNLGINIVPAKEHAESFLMVETDRAVAAVLDDILLASFVAGVEGSGRLRHFDRCIFQARTLWHHAAQGRSGLQEGGRTMRPRRSTEAREGQKLYDKWFMQKIPPKGLNLNMPIGRGVEEGIRQADGFARSGFLQGDVRGRSRELSLELAHLLRAGPERDRHLSRHAVVRARGHDRDRRSAPGSLRWSPASIVGVLRTLPSRAASWFGFCYVEFFRNMPLLVQMFLWFFVLPELLPRFLGACG